MAYNLNKKKTSDLWHFYTPPYDIGGVLWYTLHCPFVRPSFPNNSSSYTFYRWNLVDSETIRWYIAYCF